MTQEAISTLGDVRRLEGRTSTGEWFSVDAEHIRAFDFASYFPLDEDYMDGYPDGLVEGFYLLALLDEFGSRLFPFDTETLIGWNYGMNRARFITPVLVGQPLRLSARIMSAEQRGHGVLLTTEYRGELADSERPAFLAEQLTLWREKDRPTLDHDPIHTQEAS